MVDFRRWITALAVLALFAGLASAQIGTPTGVGGSLPQSCNGNFATNAQLRGEGFTELVGDIVITCTQGAALPITTPNPTRIPFSDITVFITGSGASSAITSRLLGTTSNTLPKASEVLLIIDDPGTGLTPAVAGFGPNGPQVGCNNSAAGCVEFPFNGPNGVQVATSDPTAETVVQGPNVFQGVVGQSGANSVTFFGVPILPAASAGVQHTYRITNIRVSASGLGDQQQVSAFISSSNPTAFPVTSTSLLVGTVANPSLNFQVGRTTSFNSVTNFQQCVGTGSTKAFAATIRFSETRDGAAFKIRQSGNQNIPGAINNNSESGFVFPFFGSSVQGVTNEAGRADFGTRLKAVFFNIPSGVTIFAPVVLSGSGAQAILLQQGAEGVSDLTGFGVPFVQTNNADFQLPNTNNTATAIWEVVSSSANQIDTLSGNVTVLFASDPLNNRPSATASGISTVQGSYAPEPSQGAFAATAGPIASTSALIPRFAAPTAAPRTFIIINICQTVLLWPFVTASPGFDTGIAIANTSTDPINLDGNAQAGSCTLNWFGTTTAGTTPPPTLGCDQPKAGAVCFPVVKTGTVQATDVITVLGNTGFQGYMIAVCNFQFAHGYAAVTDLGVQHLLSNYLALVLTDDPGFCGISGATFIDGDGNTVNITGANCGVVRGGMPQAENVSR